MSSSYTTVSAIKLGITGAQSTWDTALGSLIPVASDMIDTYCGFSFGVESKIEIVRGRVLTAEDGHHLVAYANKPEITTLTTVAYRTSPLATWSVINQLATGVTIDTPVRTDWQGRRVRVWQDMGAFRQLPIQVQLTYTSGPAALPQDIVQACIALVIRAWKRWQGAYQDAIGDPNTGQLFYSLKMDREIEATLRQYRRVDGGMA
jgi:hypothetical protein